MDTLWYILGGRKCLVSIGWLTVRQARWRVVMGSIQLSHLKGFKAVRPDAHQFTKTTTVHQISAWYNSSKLSRNIWTIQEKVWIMLIPLFELKCHMIYRYIYNNLILIWICQIQISWIMMIKVGLSIFFPQQHNFFVLPPHFTSAEPASRRAAAPSVHRRGSKTPGCGHVPKKKSATDLFGLW